MEATGDYLKPYYYLLEDALPVMLVDAPRRPQYAGPQTDVSDAAWLADLAHTGCEDRWCRPHRPVPCPSLEPTFSTPGITATTELLATRLMGGTKAGRSGRLGTW